MIAEVVIRAAIVSTGADFVAYMLLTNWLTVFLLGAWFGQREGSGRSDRKGFLLYLAALIVLLLLWPGFASRFDPLPDFPFNFLQVGAGNISWLLTSASVTFLYLAHTWLVFELTSRLGDVALVRFFSRNTLFVFIVHLPLVRVLTPSVLRPCGIELDTRPHQPLDFLRRPEPPLGVASASRAHTATARLPGNTPLWPRCRCG